MKQLQATELDAILDRLDGVKRTRRGWSARCPAHRDRAPSLSIAEGSRGQVLLHCFSGCCYDDITAALDLEPARRTPPAPRRSTRDLALAIARRQPWFREETRLHYQIADTIRRTRHQADHLRRAVTAAGDTSAAWDVAARAADLDRDADRFEAMLEWALQ